MGAVPDLNELDDILNKLQSEEIPDIEAPIPPFEYPSRPSTPSESSAPPRTFEQPFRPAPRSFPPDPYRPSTPSEPSAPPRTFEQPFRPSPRSFPPDPYRSSTPSEPTAPPRTFEQPFRPSPRSFPPDPYRPSTPSEPSREPSAPPRTFEQPFRPSPRSFPPDPYRPFTPNESSQTPYTSQTKPNMGPKINISELNTIVAKLSDNLQTQKEDEYDSTYSRDSGQAQEPGQQPWREPARGPRTYSRTGQESQQRQEPDKDIKIDVSDLNETVEGLEKNIQGQKNGMSTTPHFSNLDSTIDSLQKNLKEKVLEGEAGKATPGRFKKPGFKAPSLTAKFPWLKKFQIPKFPSVSVKLPSMDFKRPEGAPEVPSDFPGDPNLPPILNMLEEYILVHPESSTLKGQADFNTLNHGSIWRELPKFYGIPTVPRDDFLEKVKILQKFFGVWHKPYFFQSGPRPRIFEDPMCFPETEENKQFILKIFEHRKSILEQEIRTMEGSGFLDTNLHMIKKKQHSMKITVFLESLRQVEDTGDNHCEPLMESKIKFPSFPSFPSIGKGCNCMRELQQLTDLILITMMLVAEPDRKAVQERLKALDLMKLLSTPDKTIDPEELAKIEVKLRDILKELAEKPIASEEVKEALKKMNAETQTMAENTKKSEEVATEEMKSNMNSQIIATQDEIDRVQQSGGGDDIGNNLSSGRVNALLERKHQLEDAVNSLERVKPLHTYSPGETEVESLINSINQNLEIIHKSNNPYFEVLTLLALDKDLQDKIKDYLNNPSNSTLLSVKSAIEEDEHSAEDILGYIQLLLGIELQGIQDMDISPSYKLDILQVFSFPSMKRDPSKEFEGLLGMLEQMFFNRSEMEEYKTLFAPEIIESRAPVEITIMDSSPYLKQLITNRHIEDWGVYTGVINKDEAFTTQLIPFLEDDKNPLYHIIVYVIDDKLKAKRIDDKQAVEKAWKNKGVHSGIPLNILVIRLLQLIKQRLE